MSRIVDCSIGFNEIDMLAIRARELSGVVNSLVVVESNKTHIGDPKPIFLKGASQLFPFNKDNYVHYIVDDLPKLFSRQMAHAKLIESAQRNAIMRPLSTMGLNDDDIIMISDIDEVPRATAVARLPDLLKNFRVVIFEQTMKKFFVNNGATSHYNNAPWFGTVACKYGHLKGVFPEGARYGDMFSPRSGCISWGYDREPYAYEYRIGDAGWHLSSMGGQSSFSMKQETVYEGKLFKSQPITLWSRFGRHNSKLFRSLNQNVINDYFRDWLIEIDHIHGTEDRAIENIEIPNCVKSNPLEFEHLFYFSKPFDKGSSDAEANAALQVA